MNRSSLQTTAFSDASQLTRLSRLTQPTRLTITEINGPWRNDVVQRLEELVRLEPGWDGYKGAPVSFNDATFALSMLEATCRDSTPAPQIVPCSNGSIQIEWHTIYGDVELLVRGPYSVRAWYSSADQDDEGEEVELSNDFLTVAQWVKEVTEPEIAYRAAA